MAVGNSYIDTACDMYVCKHDDARGKMSGATIKKNTIASEI